MEYFNKTFNEYQYSQNIDYVTLKNIAIEVAETVFEQGSLKKQEILESWGLPDLIYPVLQELILSKNPSIEGIKRSGGFRVKTQKTLSNPCEIGDKVFLRDGWEKETAERLSQLISYSDLENFLGDIKQMLKQVRKAETGEERRGTKEEFAAALVLRHGIDLLANPEIRKAVAKACKTTFPGKWHPGKTAAIEFVKKTGFPSELSGIPEIERPPDYEYLEGKVTLGELRDFQKEVKMGLRQVLDMQGKGIVTLPTGAGKTRVAVDCIRDWLTDRHGVLFDNTKRPAILWLAHTEELCEQAYTCFKDVWEASVNVCPLLLVRFWGRYTDDMTQHRDTLRQITTKPSILVSTPQRIVNLIKEKNNIIEDLKYSLSLILIDEAHRAAAPSYKNILNTLIHNIEPIATIGLTATPFRMDYLENCYEGTKELCEIFNRNLIEPKNTLGGNPKQKLQEMGILARHEFQTVNTPTVIKLPNLPNEYPVSEEDSNKIDRIMATKADTSSRRLEILKHILPIAQDMNNSILYFGPSVKDAECMTYLLRRHHIPSEVIHGCTRNSARRQIINNFKSKNIRVLCNCEVLTTGFDAPLVTHIVMARPTISSVLYEQMIGRGLRGPEFGGTEECVILNCEDNFRGDQRPQLGYEKLLEVWKNQEIEEIGQSPSTCLSALN